MLQNKMRIKFIACGIGASLIAGVFLFGWVARNKKLEEIKPYITYTHIVYIAQGCDKYKVQYGAWPSSLEQLLAGRPELDDPWDKDAWERYVVLIPYEKSRGFGEIISYGRDGKPGGTGADRDLVVRFPTEANAECNKQQGVGLKEP